MAKHFSDLTLLHVYNQHLFLQHHGVFFIPVSEGKTDGSQTSLLVFGSFWQKHAIVCPNAFIMDKVLTIAKVHMSMGTLQGAVALVACVHPANR